MGDPFEPANYHINSRSFEIGVLEFFSDLWELDRERMWGYISSGGTESNIQGILVGRENLPGARLFFSSDSHYSVFKAARLLK